MAVQGLGFWGEGLMEVLEPFLDDVKKQQERWKIFKIAIKSLCFQNEYNSCYVVTLYQLKAHYVTQIWTAFNILDQYKFIPLQAK